MSTILERIIEEVRALNPDEQQQLREMLEREARTAELRRIRGKYAHIATSSDDFARQKQEEIELEDRRR